jgi:hypothetical protein
MIHGVIHFACGRAFPFLNSEAAEEIALFKKKIGAIMREKPRTNSGALFAFSSA